MDDNMAMRAVLTNIGSLGDVQPLIALAAELKRAGHSPILALPPVYATYIVELGLEFRSIGLDLDYRALQAKDTCAAVTGSDPINRLRESLKYMATMLPQCFEELSQICSGADVLISGHLQPTARMVHETIGIPFVSVHTNHFGWRQWDPYRRATASVVNPFRQRLGLLPLEDPIHVDANSPQLALYAISRHLRGRSASWPRHYYVTGFFFLEYADYQPDASLGEFIQGGEAPVIVSFSSLVIPDPERGVGILLDALKSTGVRVIVQRGWSELALNTALPPHFLSTGFVQHTWLFPRGSCVIHAGGAGTVGATLHAGVPSIVIPTIGDQPVWAELLRGIGCAAAVLPYHAFTSEAIAASVRTALSDTSLRARSAQIGRYVRIENGVASARELIEGLVLGNGAALSN